MFHDKTAPSLSHYSLFLGSNLQKSHRCSGPCSSSRCRRSTTSCASCGKISRGTADCRVDEGEENDRRGKWDWERGPGPGLRTFSPFLDDLLWIGNSFSSRQLSSFVFRSLEPAAGSCGAVLLVRSTFSVEMGRPKFVIPKSISSLFIVYNKVVRCKKIQFWL